MSAFYFFLLYLQQNEKKVDFWLFLYYMVYNKIHFMYKLIFLLNSFVIAIISFQNSNNIIIKRIVCKKNLNPRHLRS